MATATRGRAPVLNAPRTFLHAEAAGGTLSCSAILPVPCASQLELSQEARP